MINLIGDNPRAARYAGADIAKNTILVFMLSGAFAATGMVEVSGVVHRLQERIWFRMVFGRRGMAGKAKSMGGDCSIDIVWRPDCRQSGKSTFWYFLHCKALSCSGHQQ